MSPRIGVRAPSLRSSGDGCQPAGPDRAGVLPGARVGAAATARLRSRGRRTGPRARPQAARRVWSGLVGTQEVAEPFSAGQPRPVIGQRRGGGLGPPVTHLSGQGPARGQQAGERLGGGSAVEIARLRIALRIIGARAAAQPGMASEPWAGIRLAAWISGAAARTGRRSRGYVARVPSTAGSMPACGRCRRPRPDRSTQAPGPRHLDQHHPAFAPDRGARRSCPAAWCNRRPWSPCRPALTGRSARHCGQADARIIARPADALRRRRAGAPGGPLVVLFKQRRADAADDGAAVREDADPSVRRLVLPSGRSTGLEPRSLARCPPGRSRRRGPPARHHRGWRRASGPTAGSGRRRRAAGCRRPLASSGRRRRRRRRRIARSFRHRPDRSLRG